jgi:tetratricopeptide (TPR) repeat protein
MNRLDLKRLRTDLLANLAIALGVACLLVPAAASAQAASYLPGINDRAQDLMREGLSSALRKLPKCNQFQLLETGECCAPGFASLGRECARIAPPVCAAVAIDSPESCNITRCAKYTRTVETEVDAIGDDGKPTGQKEKKSVEEPCQPWVNGKRDLACELDTYDCKKEELASGPNRWCGDWVKEIPAQPGQVDAGGKPVGPEFVRCKPGSDPACRLDVRECMGDELKSGKSEGVICKIGEYMDAKTGNCSAYSCPAQCRTADGRCAKCGPDYPGAAESFSKAIDADKRFYEAYFNLGMALERQGKHKDAVATYEKAIAIEPKDDHERVLQLTAQAYKARAWLADAHRLDEAAKKDEAKALREKAKELCQSVIGQDPDNAMAKVALALYYLEGDTQNLEIAEQQVRDALRTNRDDTIALNIRGIINLRQGKNDIARWILEEKVLALDPANAEALANLGLAYVRLGDLPKAVAALERAVKLNPTSIAARMDLGAIYLEYLNYRDADKQYAVALKLEPDNLEALTGRALTLEGKRKPQEAAELYEKVLSRDPERHALEVRLALIYNKAPFNDGNKSIVYWKRYLKSIGVDPDKRQDIVNQLKAELDATRAQLKTMAVAPKKPTPDFAKQKADVVKKETEQTMRWKNVVAISSFIDAIEQGMLLEKQAKEQGEKKPDAPAATTPAPEAPK